MKRRRKSRSTDFSVFKWHDDIPVDSSLVPEPHDTENTDPQYNTNAPPVGRKGDVDYGMGDMKADRTGMDGFKAYCKRGKKDYKSFGPSVKASVELMEMMNKYGGSWTLYDTISKWHIDNLEAERTVTPERLHKTLIERYNMEATMPKEVPVRLPFAGETVNMCTHDCGSMITDLLTDPRLGEWSRLFYNDDPQSGHPMM